MSMKLSDIQLLDDDALYARLCELSVDIGPIVDSTRSMYQMMLFNRLNEMDAACAALLEFPTLEERFEKARRSVSKSPADEPLPIPANPSPHTFKRWNEVNDPFENKLFDDAVSFRSRASLIPQTPISLYDTSIHQPLKKGGSVIKTVLLIAFVFVLAAFIIFVVTQARDPYKSLESEADTQSEDIDTSL